MGPDLVAHRGWPARYPENTRSGLAASLDVGARWLEVDVQLTADGVPVLFHDATLDRVCGVAGRIEDLDLDAVRSLRATEAGRLGDRFADEPVATLADLVGLLAPHRRARAFVEVKPEAVGRFGAAEVVARTLRALAPVASRCVLISSSLPALEEARRRGHGRRGLVVARFEDALGPQAAGMDYVFCDVTDLPAVGHLDTGAARLVVYDVVDPARVTRLGARGVALVETFDIGGLLAAGGGPA